jgi:2-polyprenyl-6-hydroxyphenyl methylase/3-demethylubiquinone-9 3-methyltransferase
MPGRDYFEARWAAVPPDAVPSDFALRMAFLAERVAPGERVLDLGCGDGRFASALREAGIEVVAADAAESALARARARDPTLDLRLIEPQGPLPFADSVFDVVWAGELIEHVADTQAWFSEVRRVLRGDGRLLLSTPNHSPLAVLGLALHPGAFDRHFDPRADHLRFYTGRTLTALLADFAFEPVELRAAGGRPGRRRVLLTQARRVRLSLKVR